MEKYIRRCLNSLVLKNDDLFSYLEVLVINDGSGDLSSEIAHEYQIKYPTVFRVIDKDNGNYGSCINLGLKEATGKYIKVLDADDYFDSAALVIHMQFLLSTDVDMIITGYNIIDDHDKICKRITFPYGEGNKMFLDDYCGDTNFVDFQMHGVTYKLSNITKNFYSQTEGVSYTDQEWIFRPVVYMNTFSYQKIFLYQYLVGRKGQTVDKDVTSTQMGIHFMLGIKRVNQYNNCIKIDTISEQKKNYLKNRLTKSICLIYVWAIVNRYCDEEEIREFDNSIRCLNEDIYRYISISNYSRFHGIKYIEYWRKHNKLPLSIKILTIIKQYLNMK